MSAPTPPASEWGVATRAFCIKCGRQSVRDRVVVRVLPADGRPVRVARRALCDACSRSEGFDGAPVA